MSKADPDLVVAEDPELWTHTRRVIGSAHSRLLELRESGVDFERYSSYPKFETGEGTYRRVTTGTGPFRYESVFGLDDRWGVHVRYRDLDGYDDLVDHVRATPRLRDYFAPPRLREDFGERMLFFNAGDLALEILERHLHTVGWTLDEDALTQLYLLKERWCLHHDDLPAELLVPIVGISFTEDRIDLEAGCYIERMDDGTQLARWPATNRALEHENAVRACTHALVLPDQRIGAEEVFAWWSPLDAYPVEQVEELFEALAVASPEHGGYVQLIYRPLGWADHFRGDLPSLVDGPTLPRYPSRLRRSMDEPADVLDADQSQSMAARYAAIRHASSTVRIATQRLVSASRREEDIDRVLDLCIGIEALVSDPAPGDTTYKMAMRTSVVAGHAIQPKVTFDALKAVYSYRSAVVHGQKGSGKKRVVHVGDEKYRADSVAEFYLRELARAFLDDPSLNPRAIDDLILKALDPDVAAGTDSSDN